PDRLTPQTATTWRNSRGWPGDGSFTVQLPAPPGDGTEGSASAQPRDFRDQQLVRRRRADHPRATLRGFDSRLLHRLPSPQVAVDELPGWWDARSTAALLGMFALGERLAMLHR